MQNKLITFLLGAIAFGFIHTNALAALWNLSDTTYTYNGSDSNGASWVQTIDISPVANQSYYQMVNNNYENNSQVLNIFIKSDDISIQYSTDGSSWEYWIDLSKLNSFWITADGAELIKHSVGFNSTYNAYYVENYKVDTNDNKLSPSDIYYFVEGNGLVMEVDYWVGTNAPYVQKRTDWNPPTTGSPVPEPTTMLLFGAGLAGLAAVGRRRRS